ncbi:hypothetical protein [Cyclobacterium qasimii]|uniref:Uncharacterized protein n=2 Tax=Cyclobacterium qasimii TaxID=1350429 RepID=S7WW81_9BACT|nr:hypothetical protein [Cyclobacterium qasimii]EPR71039.1 hypothetical protein ADICYQ_0630 [Cyclobacterium qasimii M12-11B]GEO24035.1 hypothetical protein CQA01_45690 [Cyclobacterium qasimii]
MKDNYKKSISLQCDTCGETLFEYNEDKNWVKCKLCDREYHGGYEELVKLNESEFGEELNKMKKEITKDIKVDFNKMLKGAFKDNDNIKFK